jgi:hypothetical protein
VEFQGILVGLELKAQGTEESLMPINSFFLHGSSWLMEFLREASLLHG